MPPKLKRKPTVELFMRKGYFPPELPPPFVTAPLADSLSKVPNLKDLDPKWSKCAFFSIPKSWPARRVLSVPNPLHQLLLSASVANHWQDLHDIFSESTISVSTPTMFTDGVRAVSRAVDFDRWSTERFQRSADSRFVLRTDLSRFYNTIYTHSLPWAIHGKDIAKADRSAALFGNVLDTRVRNTQDQQTMGLPVGPDTSFALAEVIGARIDQDLLDDIPTLRGTRYVDDFHLYFDSRAEAEAGFTALARVAKKYELEVNDRKTAIFEGPDTGEPPWKTALRLQTIRGKGEVQKASLISYVSKVFDLAKNNPSEGVLAYGVKKAAAVALDNDNARIFEGFLRAALVHDSSTMPLVTRILFERDQSECIVAEEELTELLGKLTTFHSELRHQYEVCWLLWLSRMLEIDLPEASLQVACEMDDPFAALLLP
jgi:Reverse transcriptase (RNA-dependent DNA polymerase)